jgi:Cu2+-exporting ATPase
VNDSPALAYADVSISIEGATDVAVETADIVLPGGLGGLPACIDLARDTVGLIRENIRLVAVPNLAGMALAAAGALGPFAATGINNGSTIVAGLNSLRPLRTPART